MASPRWLSSPEKDDHTFTTRRASPVRVIFQKKLLIWNDILSDTSIYRRQFSSSFPSSLSIGKLTLRAKRTSWAAHRWSRCVMISSSPVMPLCCTRPIAALLTILRLVSSFSWNIPTPMDWLTGPFNKPWPGDTDSPTSRWQNNQDSSTALEAAV